MTEETAATFSLRVSRVNHSHGDDEYRMTIVDQASRLPVAELSLTATQFAEAITGLSASDVAGTLPEPAARRWLGKQMDHYSVTIQATEEAAREWGEEARRFLDADTVSVSRVRGGKQVAFRWYRPQGSPAIDHVVAASLLPPRPPYGH